MNTNVDMNKLQDNAVKIFTSGFACSESLIAAIRDALELDIPDSAIAMSSGFPLGNGRCRMSLRCCSRRSYVYRFLIWKKHAGGSKNQQMF